MAHNAESYLILIPFVDLALLTAGSVLFFQKAATARRVSFGLLLIVLGIALALILWVIFQGPYYPYYDSCYYYHFDDNSNLVCDSGGYVYYYYSSTLLYSAPAFIWIPSAIVGITILAKSRRKKQAVKG